MCDKSKIGRVGFIKLADFSQVSGIITDAEIDNEWSNELDEIGTKYNLTRERVRQIKEKAIRRIRHNTNNQLLKSYLGR